MPLLLTSPIKTSKSNFACASMLFVSDIHLRTQRKNIISGFLKFLRTHALTAQSLYILGDLFEFWIGDDDPNPLHYEIAAALKILTQRGISCYFMHGNHDFLLGQHYADICGMTLLPSQQIIQLNGIRIVILHGDTLCTNDTEYQRFRRRIRYRWFQRFFLSLPLQVRLRIANIIRTSTSHASNIKNRNIMDVNKQDVMAVFLHTNAKVMIHGHTHRPAIHILPGNLHRAVLGSWEHKGSVIELTNKSITLYEFPFER